MTLYNRVLAVKAGGLIIDHLRTAINIRKSVNEPVSGEVQIFNLTDDHANLITQRGPIEVTAGYVNLSNIIYAGRIARAWSEWRSQNRLTRIAIGSNTLSLGGLGDFDLTVRSFTEPTPIRTIVATVITEDMGLTHGTMDLLPDTQQVWHWTGASREGLTSLLTPYRVNWFEDNGVIRFTRPSMSPSEAQRVVLTNRSGLLDGNLTDEGARAKTLLLSQVALGDIVDVRGRTLTGLWKIVGIRYTGDNWSSPLTSEFELRTIA